MSVNAQYTAEMSRRFGYSATWVPTTEVRLGDVGVLRNHQYERVGSLKSFGIGFEARTGSAVGILHYASEGSVSLAVKAAGDVPAQVLPGADLNARIEVSFNRENAVFFQASDSTTASIEDQHALGQSILELYEAGNWPEDYVVITQVIHATRATVLISSANQALIEFSVRGDVALGNYTLVDANAGIRVGRVHNIGTQIVAEGGLTPLFKAKGIKKRLIRPPTFDLTQSGKGQLWRRLGEEPGTEGGSVFLDDVDYEDYA